MNPVFGALPTTIFETMSGLARAHGAANLGQGFPDTNGPDDVRAVAARTLLDGYNQYPPMAGLPELREAVAAHYGRFQGLDLSASEVTVTSGATEALAASFFGLIRPGDEVLCIQPLYDAYVPLIRRAGGVPRFVTLQPPDWTLTAAMLEAAVTPATRFIVLNNPLNPNGKVYSVPELEQIAAFCVAHDLIAICDEVWEHVVFGGAAHTALMALPGMRERTVKIGSAGKIFSLTGWKVGWACAAPALTAAIAKAHQFLTFTTPPNLQVAAAYGLGKEAAYFHDLSQDFGRAYEGFRDALEEIGYVSLPASGTYFLTVDLVASGIALDDQTFARQAVVECGVATIPVSSFYEQDPPRHLLRLCFAKAPETLSRGLAGLEKVRSLSN